MTNPLFYAKILLFGEYGIIEDSQGLTLPYSFYKGTLKFSDLESDFEKKSNDSLLKYSEYLKDLQLPETFQLDISKFKKDINVLRGAANGEFYLDVKNPKLHKKVVRYYENQGVVFSGDPEDDYEMLIDYLYEDLNASVEVV